MKLRTHTCRARCCSRVIPTSLLMCIEHWRMVPAPLRREIYQAYRTRDSGEAEWQAYHEAVDKAIQEVAKKTDAKAAQRVAQGGDLFVNQL